MDGSDRPTQDFSDADQLRNFARLAKVAALLCFLLPWVTVSCAGQKLGSVSGLTLASGRIAMRNPVTGTLEAHYGAPHVLIVIAGAAIAIALLVSFLWSRRMAATTGVAACLIALALIAWDVLLRLPQQFREAVRAQREHSGGFSMPFGGSLRHIVKVEPSIGLWLVLGLLAVGALLNWMVRRQVPAEPDEP